MFGNNFFGIFENDDKIIPTFQSHNYRSITNNSQQTRITDDLYQIKIIANNANEIKRNGYRYCTLPHHSTYGVKMENRSLLRVNAYLHIDDVLMGCWRINPMSNVIIERPQHSPRKFLFVKEGSGEGNMGRVQVGKIKNGLVEVEFIPDADIAHIGYDDCITNSQFISNSLESSNFSAGGTVLGKSSGQTFRSADHIVEDIDKSVKKCIRLIIDPQYQYIKRDYDDPIPPRLDNYE